MAGLVEADEDSAQFTFPPPLIYLGVLLLGLLADWLLGLSLALPMGVRVAALVVLLLAGAFLLLGARSRFVGAGTDVKPWKTTSAVVSQGIYAFTRNPMYLGMALIYLGLAIAFLSLSALVLLPLVLVAVQTQVIAREERYLEAKFGDEYRAYKARVRRWL
jgi:protein-S-isoprenylcysteine O-methyltransferase Ste14